MRAVRYTYDLDVMTVVMITCAPGTCFDTCANLVFKMESRKVGKLRKRYASKKHLGASAKAAKRWNLVASPQQDQGEESVYSKSQKAAFQSSIGEVDQGSSPLESPSKSYGSSSDRSRELDSHFANPMPTIQPLLQFTQVSKLLVWCLIRRCMFLPH